MALGLLSLLWAARADARSTVVVLSFGGDAGAQARRQVVRNLKSTYRVLGSDKLLAACDELGISMSRGQNLAKACKHLGAIAVVGGSAGGGRLAVAVYSGADGDVVAKGAFRWRRDLRRAVRLIRGGLKKVPTESEPTFTPDEPITRRDPSGPAGGSEQGPGADDPDPARGGDDPALSFDPDGGGKGRRGDGDMQAPEGEDPLALERRRKAAQEAAGKKTENKSERTAPAVLGYVGFGTWMRSFSLNDAVPDRSHPQYDSGATFALQIALRSWPLAFFLDGFPAGIWLRLHYQTAIGLTSGVAGGSEGLSTSMSEFMFDFGYDLKIGSDKSAPHLDINFGYGGLSFAIDWGAVAPTLPAADYTYVALGAGMRWPFHDYVGFHIRADYRFVLGTGEIEIAEPDRWYGPSTTGGIAGAAGLHGRYLGIVASLEYSYTRFFYTFDQAQARQAVAQRAAGGALDQFHSVIVGLGYSY